MNVRREQEQEPMLVGAPVRGTVAIGDVDPWTLMSGDFQGSDEPQRWGEIMLRAMVRSEYQTGNVRVEHTWTSMGSVRLLEQPTRMEEVQVPLLSL